MLIASNPVRLLTSVCLIQRSTGVTQQARGPRVHERWAHLRFSVIGQLLAAPPPKGELRAVVRFGVHFDPRDGETLPAFRFTATYDKESTAFTFEPFADHHR
jgi:hypothetical protein